MCNFKRTLSVFFNKISRVLLDISKILNRNTKSKSIDNWFKDFGDKTHRLNYDLNNNSIVFDLGGYKGKWASDIYSMYCCNIFIFEPVPQFEENIKKRFIKNLKIKTYQFGLAHGNIKTRIYLSKDGSSIFKKNNNSISIILVKIDEFLKNNKIKEIDLLKINIEGGEYDLLEYLIDKSLVKNIKNLQIQFHDFVPNARQRMQQIQRNLVITHRLTYQYEFVWENWELKQ